MWGNALSRIFGWPAATAFVLGLCTVRAFAGPPYHSDDPEPTDYQHYEIYAFTNGIVTQDGTSGAGGIDFNYGGAPNLQLTATFPIGYAFPSGGSLQGGLSNIELAAKYRFLTQANAGVDVAIFPRAFLPSASPNIGQSHASFLFPVWLQKDSRPASLGRTTRQNGSQIQSLRRSRDRLAGSQLWSPTSKWPMQASSDWI
jgi:hypothetical protein